MRWIVMVVAIASCQTPPGNVVPSFPTGREACADRSPLRRALYGDLHVHTLFSFDAGNYGNVLTPADAYAFARGQTVRLPPLDAAGQPTRETTIDRPLDFVAVTDHAEFLGEVKRCTDPTSEVYQERMCVEYREGNGAFNFGVKLASPGSSRFSGICGPRGDECQRDAQLRWWAMQKAAEEAYDRSSRCSFTAFVGYEYTNTAAVSNLHRNVVFRSSVVPELPISMFEAPRPMDLWRKLKEECRVGLPGCDVLVLPHNSNLSNGNLFSVNYPAGATEHEQAELAALRQEMEPVVEVFQHKGDSECRSGFAADNHEPDPLCEFEKLRVQPFEDCVDTPGAGGMRLGGCLHPLDFVRNVLKEGLREGARVGVNPYRLGFIASTDTHNATPGHVGAEGFPGHVGVVDDTPEKRLGAGNVTHDGIINNPGGIAAVWAEENTREAIFDAMMRRETFATSGPRIEVRLFGGWDFDASICAGNHDAMLEVGYERGVPMGGTLSATAGAAAPRFIIQAKADRLPLERLQIIKGWYAVDGSVHEKVYDVAVAGGVPGAVDEDTCETSGEGFIDKCEVWTDPDYDAATPAFYYARVIENPSCRWSTHQCNSLQPDALPAGCIESPVPKTVQQRAWSSPIWTQ